ncbi:MAG: TIGR03619 family F420-dependent LLM class oxidoreductase [Actinomycetota bacterium]|nr:TIGR03619 family F420-dependent LLM class oxidoreductase [Actinomycetota bacterium]
MKLGVALGRLNPAFFVDVTLEAEKLGYESVWLPEHLVFPVAMAGSPHRGDDHPPVPPRTPVFDAFAYLSFLAGKTHSIRLATHVYNLALRHPFVAARAVQTLDVVSGGRAICGVGAGWLEAEWRAAGLDFASRGRRLDEALEVCKRLWTEDVIEHHGEFWDFGAVAFEPKPVQKPHPPVLIGGMSDAALRRAARAGDGWVGMDVDVESIGPIVARLHELCADAGRSHLAFEISVGAVNPSPGDVRRWAEAGVDRLIVSPWSRSREAIDALRALAGGTLGT